LKYNYSMARFLLSIFIMLLNSDQLREQLSHGRASTPCPQADACALSFWMTRAARLGAVLESAMKREVAIDAYTPCLPESVRESKDGVTVRVHARFTPELEATVPAAPLSVSPRGGPPKLHTLTITLLKWVAVSLTDTEYVVCFDLDMDVFLPALERHAAVVARQWLDVFARMRDVGAQLASLPDQVSPINAGFMIVRPNRSLYEEGVQLLLRANSSFSRDEGWDLVGPPQATVPATDVMQLPRTSDWPAHGWIAKWNRWQFVGAAFDQGFFFHMCVAFLRRRPPSRPVPAFALRPRRQLLASSPRGCRG
jgi:hypothetical protein